MSNSTDEYWDVDGQSLQTYAFNIQSWGGDRQAPPSFRGSNVVIPGMPGRIATERQVDSRVITLGMWVVGATEDGNAPEGGSRRSEFERNWDKLTALLWTPRRMITLTKRFRRFGSDTVIVASAKGRFAGGLAPTMNGTTRALFTVDIELADPYFYGAEVALPAFTGVSSSQDVTVLGDDRTTAVMVEISGNRVNTKIKVTNPSGEVQTLNYTYSLGSTDKASIDVKNFSARTTPGSGSSFPSGGLISHTGGTFWLALDPGISKVEVTSTSGAGNVVIKYKPVFI